MSNNATYSLRGTRVCLLVASVVLSAACSGESSGVLPAVDPQPTTSSEADPQPSAAAPSEPATGPSPTAAPTASSTPRPSNSSAGRFESDPAVKALRAYYAAVSDAINQQNIQLPALLALSGPKQRTFHSNYREEFGYRSPGPVPFEPLSVAVNSSTQRTVTFCGMNDGWTRDKKTNKPRKPVDVVAVKSVMVRRSGHWIVDDTLASSVSCEEVKLP